MIFNITGQKYLQDIVGVMFVVLLSSGCAATQERPISNLERITIELSSQLYYPTTVATEVRKQKVATTLFVDADDLEATNRFGSLLRSSITAELQKKGFKISHQIQNLPAVQILTGGDLRNNPEFRSQLEQNKIDHLLTATVTRFEQGALVVVQIVQISTSSVLLSAQSELSKKEYDYFINDRNIKPHYEVKNYETF